MLALLTWEAYLHVALRRVDFYARVTGKEEKCMLLLSFFSKNPVLFRLDNFEHTVYKCPMSLQAKGTRETSVWNHQKLKKYVGYILLPSMAALYSKLAQSGHWVIGIV